MICAECKDKLDPDIHWILRRNKLMTKAEELKRLREKEEIAINNLNKIRGEIDSMMRVILLEIKEG